jgi:2-phosphosulfolactate phosphatase
MTSAVCDWGPEGVRHYDGRVGAIVVVDVLSFSTCVDVAVGRGARVYPFPDGDRDAAAALAISFGGEVAGPRGNSRYRYSLSPVSLFAVAAGTKLVLPSPNGSAISFAARSAPVLTGCLRNARAVARKAAELARGTAVAVIPAGERWPDGGLRPAIEDLIGAGAIIQELGGACSPEAEVARQAYLTAGAGLGEALRRCVSGLELIQRGFPEDVEVALAVNVSVTAPCLVDGAYTN